MAQAQSTDLTPVAATTVIEADDAPGADVDSTYGDDSESYTTSLKSSVLKFKFENGRRYHAQGQDYWLPNDESEQERLDMNHHLYTLRCDGKLYMAPIGSEVKRILDIGTGTGIWAIEMGDMFPEAQIIGNDISPVQPSLIPPNVTFEVDNVEQDWAYGEKFDYIHCRAMAGSLKDWPKLMKQCFDNLKPGGWVEFQDYEMRWYTQAGEFKEGGTLDKWCLEMAEALRSIGQEPEPGPRLESWVKEAGFSDIHHELLLIPTGSWPKDKILKQVGTMDMIQFLEGLENFSARLLTGLRGYTMDEVNVLVSKLRAELRNPKLQLQHNFHIVWAQKPLDAVAEA